MRDFEALKLWSVQSGSGPDKGFMSEGISQSRSHFDWTDKRTNNNSEARYLDIISLSSPFNEWIFSSSVRTTAQWEKQCFLRNKTACLNPVLSLVDDIIISDFQFPFPPSFQDKKKYSSHVCVSLLPELISKNFFWKPKYGSSSLLLKIDEQTLLRTLIETLNPCRFKWNHRASPQQPP